METTPKPPEAPKSKSNPWKLIAIVVVILIVVGVAAYILTLPPPSTAANVHIQDDAACSPNDASCLFSPASYNATVNGSGVAWKNDGTINHTRTTKATQNGNPRTFTSSQICAGPNYSLSLT